MGAFQRLISDSRPGFQSLQDIHEQILLDYERQKYYQDANRQPNTYPFKEGQVPERLQRQQANLGLRSAVGMAPVQELNQITWVDQWDDVNDTVGAYAEIAKQTLNTAGTALSLGSGVQWLGNRMFNPPKIPVNPTPYQSNPGDFSSHKPLIRNYLEGIPLPHTIRNPIHTVGKPFQPTSPNRIPNTQPWHQPKIRMPTPREIRRGLEGLGRAVGDRFPIHSVGKPYQPTRPTRLPNRPC
ncbi:MAG: hypothetical protein AAGA60_30115 [Cyanobacteria bacterium P01_E01_bin.42]